MYDVVFFYRKSRIILFYLIGFDVDKYTIRYVFSVHIAQGTIDREKNRTKEEMALGKKYK